MSDFLIAMAFIVVFVLFGYLAACANAGRGINFIDWLLLRSKP